MNACDLSDKHCRPCEGGVPPLTPEESRERLAMLPGWQLGEHWIEKSFSFANHHRAMVFVNAVAGVSHRENHHPEMTVGYNEVRIRYWTHAIGGLSDNDFICAAKLDKIVTR